MDSEPLGERLSDYVVKCIARDALSEYVASSSNAYTPNWKRAYGLKAMSVQGLLLKLGDAHQFPFEIESLTFKDVRFSFQKSMLNIVCGGSWLLKASLGAAGIHSENEALKKGVVTLKRTEGQCLTVDVLSMDPLLLNELRDCLSGVQIIASTPLTFNTEMFDGRAAFLVDCYDGIFVNG